MAAKLITLTLGVMCVLAGSTAEAATEKLLWSFRGGRGGDTPLGNVIMDASGNIYGTTSGEHPKRKSKDFGTVFKLSLSKGHWFQQLLHRFEGKKAGDGAWPSTGLIMDTGGSLYGTTFLGGSANQGVAFKLTPPIGGSGSWTETILHTFAGGGSDGVLPSSGLIFGSNGALYGTTLGGGVEVNGGNGTVFSLNPPAAGKTVWTETVLYRFQGGSDGRYPDATLIPDQSGALYGVTQLGGNGTLCSGGQGCGTVFKLIPPPQGQTEWSEQVLYSFTGGADGSMPMGALVFDGKGNLYGTASGGGNTNGAGAVFKLAPPLDGSAPWRETVLHIFAGGPDGQTPESNLVFDAAGALYGTTLSGGDVGNQGTVFKLTPPTGSSKKWHEKIIHDFPGSTDDGFEPAAGFLLSQQGLLYGTTSRGGAGAYGTVFRLVP